MKGVGALARCGKGAWRKMKSEDEGMWSGSNKVKIEVLFCGT
eukprot:CAMPEP_0114012210 /NCGR_PEP_ID=MMETSP0372-20130328/9224_1 /TAXON_ID=340204 /ORGANISM="Lankesteria abbotti" /LENGTH=41 /assembly_acc=CAM_ASM_000359